MRMIRLVPLILACATGAANAQEKYPAKPIRLLVGYVAGGQPDALARMIGQKLGEQLKTSVVIDNRPGGGGTIAALQVARANADGYTLLLAGANFSISAATEPKLPYAPLQDFAGVSKLGLGTVVLTVAPTSGIKSISELVAGAKAQPGKLIFASPPAGSGPHLTGAAFALGAGLKVITVAYKGSPEAMIEVMAGRAHYSMATVAAAMPFVKDRKLTVLAVNLPKRSPLFPDVPSLTESLPGYEVAEAYSWLLAPAKTPAAILNILNQQTAAILDLPDIRERLQSFGFNVDRSAPQDYVPMIRQQIAGLSRLAAAAGLKGNK